MAVRRWSQKSLVIRATLDRKLQRICDRLLSEVHDISLISGHRSEKEQNKLFKEGKSHLQYPASKHNAYPSKAVDLQPWPYAEDEKKLWETFGYIAGHAMRIAEEEGITLRWGGDWSMTGELHKNQFEDLFHFEIIDD